MWDVISRASEQVFLPLTVGGGIRSTEDFRRMLACGADKIAVNSAAIKDPTLITEAAMKFGRQCVVLAVDAKRNEQGRSDVYLNGGRVNTGKDAIEWIAEGVERGAGEVLLTSMDRDGTKAGYDLELTRQAAEAVNVPVIASGGAGKMGDFYDVLTEGEADAALAASLFHFGIINMRDLKNYLAERGLPIRTERVLRRSIIFSPGRMRWTTARTRAVSSWKNRERLYAISPRKPSLNRRFRACRPPGGSAGAAVSPSG